MDFASNRKIYVFDVVPGRPKNETNWSKNQFLGEKGAKSRARLVYYAEGRHPGEGVGGGEIHPRVGKEGLRAEDTPKPPQPRGLVGLSLLVAKRTNWEA